MSKELDQAQVALGNAIRKIRSEKGLIQEELAHQAGINRSYMSDFECGRRNLSLKNICKIAKALDLSAGDLLNRAGL